MKVKLFAVFVLLLFSVSGAHADMWKQNDTVVSGLTEEPNMYMARYYQDGGMHLLTGAGGSNGGIVAYTWNGSTFNVNSSRMNGLSSSSEPNCLSVFDMDGKDNLIYKITQNVYGFDWNGTKWLSNSTLVSGLSVSWNGYFDIFEINNEFYLIEGDYKGDFHGFKWNFTGWIPNATVIDGLVSLEGETSNQYATPDAYISPFDGGLWLVVGADAGRHGYRHNGTLWVRDDTEIYGLSCDSGMSAYTIFNDTGGAFAISSSTATGFPDRTGYLRGFTWNYRPTTPSISAPTNNSYHTSQPITIQASSTDADSDSLTYYFYGDTVDGSTLLGTSTNGTYVWHQYISDDYILKVRAYDGYEYSDYSNKVYFHSLIPPLLTTDLIHNGSFENWSSGPNAAPDGWDAYQSPVSITRISGYDGYGVELISDATWDGIKNEIGIGNLKEGDKLTLSFKAKSTNSATMRIEWKFGTGGTQYNQVVPTTTSFSTITKTMTVPANADSLGIILESEGANTYTFDNVILVEGTYPYVSEPLNNSVHTFPFPPLLHDMTFVWQDSDADGYKYQIASDEDFNLIAEEGSLSTYTTDVSLSADDYFWRLFAYDPITDTYSDSSDVWQFTINETTISDGTAIDGVVYEITTAGSVAVEGALVNIWNTTWSGSTLVGQNGYYYFDGLHNSTYSLRATKTGYTGSAIELVTVLALNTTTRNILLQSSSGAGQEYVDHYVKFTVTTLWGTLYSGVDVNVYLGDAIIATYTGTTGSDGSVAFELNENQEYRFTFVSATHGIDEELIIYPVKDSYSVYIYDTLAPDDEDIESEEVTVSVTTAEINDTHAYINVTYTDAMNETTDLNIYINQSDESDPFNQTIITYANLGATSSITHSFTVNDYPGQAYFINVGATHTTFGDIGRTYSVRFEGMLEDHGFSKIWVWIGVGGMMFVAGMFKASKAVQGSLVVCVVGWIFMAMGLFDSLGSKGVISMAAGLGLATVLSVGANMSKKHRDETI